MSGFPYNGKSAFVFSYLVNWQGIYDIGSN